MQIIYETVETRLASQEMQLSDELKPIWKQLRRIGAELNKMLGAPVDENKLLELQQELNDIETTYTRSEPIGIGSFAVPGPKGEIQPGQSILSAQLDHVHRLVCRVQEHLGHGHTVGRQLLPMQTHLVAIRAALEECKAQLKSGEKSAAKDLGNLAAKLDAIDNKDNFTGSRSGQMILRVLIEENFDLLHECYLLSDSSSSEGPWQAIHAIGESISHVMASDQVEAVRRKLSAAWEDLRDYATRPGTTSESTGEKFVSNPPIGNVAFRLALASLQRSYDILNRVSHRHDTKDESVISQVTEKLLNLRDELRNLRDKRNQRAFQASIWGEELRDVEYAPKSKDNPEGGLTNVQVEDAQKLRALQERLDAIDSERDETGGGKWVEKDGSVKPGQASAADLLNNCYSLVRELQIDME
jgi:hypothetical protein